MIMKNVYFLLLVIAMSCIGFSIKALDYKNDGSISNPALVMSMSSGGEFILTTGNTETYKIHLSMSSAESGLWFSTAHGALWTNVKKTFSTETKSSSFSGETVIPGTKNELSLCFSATALDNGRILISVDFDSRQMALKELLKLSNIHIHINRNLMDSCVFDIDGKEYRLPPLDAERKKGSIEVYKGRPASLKVFANCPEKMLNFIPVTASGVGIRDCVSDINSYVELRFEPVDKRIAFEIASDPRASGLMPQTGSGTYGNVDFWASGSLMMPDYKSSKNLIQNPGFENALHYWQYGSIGSVTESPENEYIGISTDAYKGRKAALIRGRTGQDPAKLTSFAIPLNTGENYVLSFFAKSNKDKARLLVMATSFNWPLFPIDSSVNLSTEWKRYSFSFKAPNGGISIGFGIHKPSFDYDVMLDCVQLEKAVIASEFTERAASSCVFSSSRSNWIEPGNKINAYASIYAPESEGGILQVTATDFFGRESAKFKRNFVNEKEGYLSLPLPELEALPRGLHIVKTELFLKNGFKTRDFSRIMILPFADGAYKNKSLFSVGFADSRQGNWQRRTEFWKRAGIGSMINFLNTDPLAYDKIIKENGILLMSCLLQSGEKIGGVDFRKDLERIATIKEDDLLRIREEAAKKVKDKPDIKYWKLMNEPPRDYNANPALMAGMVKAMNAAAEGARQANPDIIIFSPDPPNMYRMGMEFIDGFIAAGGKKSFDIVAIHPYRPRPEAPDMDADMAAFIELLNRRGYNNEIWFTEGIYHQNWQVPAYGLNVHNACSTDHYRGGTFSYALGWGEKMNAAYTARSWLVGLKYSDKVKMYVDWGFASNCSLDLDMTPGANVFASNTLCNLLGDSSFKKDIPLGGDLRCYAFDDGHGNAVFAIWSFDQKMDAGDDERVNLKFAELNLKAELIDITGTVNSFPSDGLVNISPFPVFIRCNITDFERMSAFISAAKNTRSNLAPCLVWLDLEPESGTVLKMKNETARQLKLNLALKNDDKTILRKDVQIDSLSTIKIPLGKELIGDSFSGYSFLTPLDGSDSVSIPLQIKQFTCRKTSEDILAFSGKTASDFELPDTFIVKDYQPYTMELTEKYPTPIKWQGKNDLSAEVFCAWDAKNFYLKVLVWDDKHDAWKGEKPYDAWKGDSIQIYFDCWGDARSHKFKGYDNNDQSFVISDAGNGKLNLYRDAAPEQQVAFLKNGLVEGVKSSFTRTQDALTIYELAIPWKEIAPVKASADTVFGFAVLINDCDGDYRKRALSVTPQGTEPYMRPDLYPLMILK